jgi:outer membrane protein assembly factor BamD (BamD/ComL family)
MRSQMKIREGECMQRGLAIFGVVLLLALSACADKAAELYETANFEELQNNKAHAVQLYEEILKKYPDSEQGRKAKERLAALKQSDSGLKQQEKQP